MRNPISTAIYCFLSRGWNFDLLYDKGIVQPFIWIARLNKKDFIDFIYKGIALLSRSANHMLSFTQSGKVRWYAFGIGIGAVVMIAIVEAL